MTFEEIIPALRDDRKVRSNSWGNKFSHIKVTEKGLLVLVDGNGKTRPFDITSEFRKTDYEVILTKAEKEALADGKIDDHELDLNRMKKSELKALAKELELDVRSNASKKTLVEAIKEEKEGES